MAITPQAVTSSLTLTCNKPLGVVSGDVLVAYCTTAGAAVTLAGWTNIGGGNASSFFYHTVLAKVAGGSEPASYTFTAAGASDTIIQIQRYTNVDAAITDVASTFASSTGAAPSLTTATGGALLVQFATSTGSTSNTPNAGMTEQDEAGPTGSFALRSSYATETRASAGATGSRTYTSDGTFYLTTMLALKPGSTAASHPLTGDLAGSALAAASNIRLDQPLAGDLAGSSLAAVGSLALAQPLAGDLAGSALAAATKIVLSYPLSGDLSGSSLAQAGGLLVGHPLLGDLAGSALATAVFAPNDHALSGDLAGEALAAALGIALAQPLAGDLAGEALAQATAIVIGHPLFGDLSGSSLAQATGIVFALPFGPWDQGRAVVRRSGVRGSLHLNDPIDGDYGGVPGPVRGTRGKP